MIGGWATMLQRWDNPETVRVRKYLTGTHLLLQAIDLETASTPSDLVWSSGPAHLVRYRPRGKSRHRVPVMLAYPPILRSYILDLVPGVSLVEYLLDEGFDVYLLDLGVPGYTDRRLTREHYVLGYLPRAVQEVQRCSGAEEITVVGHCMAGTMGAMYIAAVPEAPVRNLILVAAPIDFAPSQPGLLGAWTLWTRQRLLDPEPVASSPGSLTSTASAPTSRSGHGSPCAAGSTTESRSPAQASASGTETCSRTTR